jgi:hypothetical protein
VGSTPTGSIFINLVNYGHYFELSLGYRRTILASNIAAATALCGKKL